MKLKMTPNMKQKLLSSGDTSQYWKDENGNPEYNKTFDCWNKKPESDIKLFVSRETEIRIQDLKIQGLEAEIKVLKHIVNMYAQEEIYKNI